MELRLYCFVNFYLSSIQQGIQTGHAAVDLVRKYSKCDTIENSARANMVNDWADNYKTFIILNGGPSAGIKLATEAAKKSGLPWASFSEDYQSLEGIQTCVAVVVPENVFNCNRENLDASLNTGQTKYQYRYSGATPKDDIVFDEQHQMFALIDYMKKARLAQ